MREPFGARGTEMAECVCPECGVIHWKRLDVSYIVDPDIQKCGGCIVVKCKECKANTAEESKGEV